MIFTADLAATLKTLIMKNFAETVYNYFRNQMMISGEPLDEMESSIFRESEKLKNQYTVAFLSADDLRQLNFIVTEEEEKKIPVLAEALALEYKDSFYDCIDNLAYANGFVRCDAYDMMIKDYNERRADNIPVSKIYVIVQYKNEKIPVTANICFDSYAGNTDNPILTINSIEELKPYFDKNNRYGFYIVEHLDFY